MSTIVHPYAAILRQAAVLLLAAACFLAPAVSYAQSREELDGPFPSWANVKTRFGAKGDGRTDDTKALQTAIDSLSNPVVNFNLGRSGYMVIWLPAGTYCISSTLTLKGKIGVSIIGEDPLHTMIKWIGGDQNMLFWANGSAYFKLSRITWNANGHKNMEGIGVHWKDRWRDANSRSFASLNIELSDNNFTGGFLYGISGGTTGGGDGTGNNDSELTIRRCLFDHCTGSGIEIKGFNALDYWIWDCRFMGCGNGIHCTNGGYHVYRSFFSGSGVADLHNMHGYYNSARGCYSENSSVFSADETMSSNPFKRIFQDNTVIGAHQMPIQYYHLGKITVLGNKFGPSLDTADKFSVNYRGGFTGIYEVLSLHNIYPNANAVRIASTPKRLFTYGDRIAAVKPAAEGFLKTLDPTPPRVNRKVFEVPPGSGSAAIQAILDEAARLKGQRPVVHFGMGTYAIDRTLVIPPGCDMQLIGDGLIDASQLVKTAGGDFRRNALILVQGPSTVVLRDLTFGSDGDVGRLPAIVFSGVDQRGSQAHLDQIYSHADTSLVLRELNNLYVEKDNSFFTDGNYVSGGSSMQNGSGMAGLFCFGGQWAGVRVQKNGRFLAKDCWWEGATRIPLDLQGQGTICIDGAMLAPNSADSMPAIRIGKFDGHIALMNMYVQGALLPAADNPGLDLLAWNIHFYHKMDVLSFLRLPAGAPASYHGAFLGLNAQCFRAKDPACQDIISIPDQLVNIPKEEPFLDAETGLDQQSRPVPFSNLPAGSSNIYLSRVSILGSRTSGLVFTQ